MSYYLGSFLAKTSANYARKLVMDRSSKSPLQLLYESCFMCCVMLRPVIITMTESVVVVVVRAKPAYIL